VQAVTSTPVHCGGRLASRQEWKSWGRPYMRKEFAVLALMAIVVLGSCGDDDSDETDVGADTTSVTDQGDTGDGSGTDETSQPEAPVGDGYTDAIRTNFLNACAAQPGATQAKCECTFDEITQAVPVEKFAAYDRDLQQDPATPAPSWLADAITTCS
jgi:hypothetical protein